MIVLPATSMRRAPAGTLTDPSGPTATMRLRSTTMVPRSITPRPGCAFIGTMRAPTSAIVPLGVSLGCSKPMATPAASGSSGFSAPSRANANVFARSRV